MSKHKNCPKKELSAYLEAYVIIISVEYRIFAGNYKVWNCRRVNIQAEYNLRFLFCCNK